MKTPEQINEPWDETREYPRNWIASAHTTLMTCGGMLGVVYRRQLNRVRELQTKIVGLEAELELYRRRAEEEEQTCRKNTP